jgi:hypothetical protein
MGEEMSGVFMLKGPHLKCDQAWHSGEFKLLLRGAALCLIQLGAGASAPYFLITSAAPSVLIQAPNTRLPPQL